MNIHLPNGTRHYTAGTYSFYEEHKEHSGQQLWLHLIRYGAVMCEGVVYWILFQKSIVVIMLVQTKLSSESQISMNKFLNDYKT